MLTLLIYNCYTNCESESITLEEWDFNTDMWRTSAAACLVLSKQNQIHRTKAPGSIKPGYILQTAYQSLKALYNT